MMPLHPFKDENYRNAWRDGYIRGVEATFNLALRWISVKDRMPERLPEGFKSYLVASWSFERKIYHVGVYDWRDTYFEDRLGEKILIDDGYWAITHWMPLPEPPK